MTDIVIGKTEDGSTTTRINVIITDEALGQALVGKFAYFDFKVVDNRGETPRHFIARALGTITDVTTKAPNLQSDQARHLFNEDLQGMSFDSSLKVITFAIQSAFTRDVGDSTGRWQKSAGSVPTSPEAGTSVYLASPKTIEELMTGEERNIVHIGQMRGLEEPAPLVIPDYRAANGGAYHTGFVGRSGSGKTVAANLYTSTFLQYPNHGIIVVDPQGQWASEAGFLVSVQKTALAMGREVKVFRIAEGVKLPMNGPELLGSLIQYLNVWTTAFRKMAVEPQEALSTIIAERLYRAYRANQEAENLVFAPENVKDLLKGAFRHILEDNKKLRLIYATEDRQNALKEDIMALLGMDPEMDDLVEIGEDESAEYAWERILAKFTPLLNLFNDQNLQGEPRVSFGGRRGLITKMMDNQGKSDDDPTKTPAPYIVIDMSADTKSTRQAEYARQTQSAGNEAFVAGMNTLLDNDDFKAVLITNIMNDIKDASATAYADGMTLNTQILFDEAWRYARPTSSNDSEAMITLSSMLAGFALDTRKYGIGWTYILQLPSSLHPTILSQLTNLYATYGVVGSERKAFEDKMDERDRRGQMSLYAQFIHPSMTQEYPMMMLGNISPLIFTESPTFLNVFTSTEQFYESNKHWLKTQRGSTIPLDVLKPGPRIVSTIRATKASTHSVGKAEAGIPQAKSQTVNMEVKVKSRDTSDAMSFFDAPKKADPFASQEEDFLEKNRGEKPPF